MNNDIQVTLKTLASRLGLSVSTISKAINMNLSINAGTRARVLELAMQINYRPNLSARNLQNRKTKVIAVVVDDILTHNSCNFFTGIETLATQLGYSTILTSGKKSGSGDFSSLIPSIGGIDGLILFKEHNDANRQFHYPIIHPATPLITVGTPPFVHKGLHISLDYEQLAYQATVHLIEKGCKRISFMNGLEPKSFPSQYLKGFKRAMTEHSLPMFTEYLFSSDLTELAGRNLASRLISFGLADGIVVANNLCAASCIKSLISKGFNVPDDILFVSIGNEDLAGLMSPDLTTVSFDYQYIGKKIAETFFSAINGVASFAPEVTYEIEVKINQRNSSRTIGHILAE